MNQIEKLLLQQLCKKSFYEFVKIFWNEADPSKFIDSPLIEYYCEVFQYMARQWGSFDLLNIDLTQLDGKIIDVRQNKHNLNLTVPPRHSKSMIFNVLGPVWLWILSPIKAVSVSHTGSLASQMNSKRQKVINSQKFREIFPYIKMISNSVSFIKDNRGGELYSINRNAFTGYGGDVIINDDLTNAESARKDKEEMNNAWNYFRNTMPSRINDINKCIILNIQQRLAPNDITGLILNDQKLKNQYCFIDLPAIFSEKTHLIFPISGKIKTFEEGDFLWKERFNDYSTIRAQVGENVFQTQYLQNPISSDKTLIKSHMIVEKSIKEIPDFEESEIIYASHDFPIKDKEDSDFTGTVLAYRVDKILYIKDCLERRKSFPILVQYVEDLGYKFPGIIQIIEDKANGPAIMQQLRDKVSGLIAYNPKTNSKYQRLESASLYMESQNVVFVKDEWDENSKQYRLSERLENLKNRLLNFPFVAHDDIIDAFSMLVLYEFMEKRNGVYTGVFNNQNIFQEKLEIEDNLKTYFLNNDNNCIKISEIFYDYSSSVLFVLNEYYYDKKEREGLNKLYENIHLTNVILCENSITDVYHDKINFDIYNVDFEESTELLQSLMNRKKIKINKKCYETINDIEKFKYFVDKDNQIKYHNINDGFIKNIRTAIKYFGAIL